MEEDIQSIVQAAGHVLNGRLYAVRWPNQSDETWENREFFDTNEYRRGMRDEYDRLIREGRVQLKSK